MQQAFLALVLHSQTTSKPNPKFEKKPLNPRGLVAAPSQSNVLNSDHVLYL